jgi:hypothetical protein
MLNWYLWTFHFVFTPTNASLLNIIEIFFSKMASSILRGIWAVSKDELNNNMLKNIRESTVNLLFSRGRGKP